MVATVYKQREKIEAVFKEFDTDGDGSVNREELRYGFAKVRPVRHVHSCADLGHRLSGCRHFFR